MELFHVLNRGVDKREIFLDDRDRLRFVHDLFEFNNQDRIPANNYYFKSSDLAGPKIKRKPRKLLVDIHAFCLMPNHYHILLSPRVENGISKFMSKLNMGYAKYFNKRYDRVGTLFQGRYKAIEIKNESHFVHLPYYIHLNPLDLATPEWRDRKIYDYDRAINFLMGYRWSSFKDYVGVHNFPSVTMRDFLLSFFGSQTEYKRRTLEWLKELNLEGINGLMLE